MTPERWQQIDHLLERAVEQDPGQRAAFLDEVCAGDQELRREVESLLAYHTKAEPLLERPALELPAEKQAAEPPSLLGQRLGPYQIQAVLGAGGMGEVYKARDARLNRTVAIKAVPRRLSDRTDLRQRFAQEAKAASALNHPNIITIHDILSENGRDFIIMEYVDGKMLDRLIQQKGMPLPEVFKVAIQIADALAAAHAAGIVHRDLKPGNIIVSDKGQVKLLDFGLAKLVQRPAPEKESASETHSLTEEGAVLGTAAYMSPEQAEGKPVDARSDIFSFGAVLYEMVTGRRAFQGDTSLSILTAILREEARPATNFVPALPPGLDRLINWCLRKEPQRRIQHMDDVKLTLEDVRTEWETAIQTNPSATSRKLRWPLALSVASVTILAGLALAAWFYWPARRSEPIFSVVPLTSYPGLERSPSFSPDGNQVAFTWDGAQPDSSDIYVQMIGDTLPVRLTHDPAPEESPAWSPDGRWIAFVRLERDTYSVCLISPLGGSEQELVRVPLFGTPFQPGFTTVRLGLSWSPDSKWLVYPERPTSGEAFSLFAVSLETREKKRLTSPPRGNRFGDTSPAFSPDGRTIAFSRDVHNNIAQIHIQPLTATLEPAGEVRQLTFEDWRSESPAWTPDGRQLIYAAGPKHCTRLWRIDVAPSAQHQPLSFSSFTGARTRWPALSSAKHRLAFTQMHYDANIWRANVAGGRGSDEAPVPLIASTLLDHTPAISPNGRKIVFVSYRSGTSEIWICDSGGQNLVQLTSFNGPEIGIPRWSPDGSRIVFDVMLKAQGSVFWIPANGGSPQRLTQHPGVDSAPTWSRDGRWMYFCSDRSGREEIWKIPAQGGPASQITQNGGRMAFESWDSQWLYVLKKEYGSLWRRRIDDGKEEQIVDSVQATNFAVGSKGIYFVPGRFGQPENTIELLDPKTGKRRSLAAIHKRVVYGFAVSPDERWILYAQMDQEITADLMLVENFR